MFPLNIVLANISKPAVTFTKEILNVNIYYCVVVSAVC